MLVRVLLFASAREAAGRAHDSFELPEHATVHDLLTRADARYGPAFTAVRATSRVWVDGDEPAAGDATPLAQGAEVAVLPPVSGGAGAST